METRKLSYLERFLASLKNDWTYSAQVACYQQCDPPEECCCKRRFVHAAEVVRWMNRCDSNDSVQSNDAIPNAGRLLMEIHDKIKSHLSAPFPVDAKSILEGDTKCVLVFCILLEQNYGHFIDLFRSARIYDKFLDSTHHRYQDSLRKKLYEKGIPDESIDEVIEGFEEAKWAYLPSKLSLHMNENFENGDFILPFCRRKVVNDKGGTASVYHVVVQEKFIVDADLKDVLKNSLYEDPEFGRCYQMALKSYSKDMHTVYEWEEAAFSGLHHDDSNSIVRYLGCYSHDETVPSREGNITFTTYNLLLEYGQVDLDEYCADLTNVPPVRVVEIIRFWESLFKVADAIKRVHKLCIRQGKKESYYDGWHADVKPDNILVVDGEFKLADFGFARFSESAARNQNPTSYIEGGTDTYGAPEFARMKRTGTKTAVTQSIDTWSFGCVLSVVATWIVLGFQGIRQYRMLRRLAPSNQGNDGKVADRFHDGNGVLPEIKHWHNFLKAHIRSSDTATPLILDLIETRMLRTDPRDRYKSEKMCKELKEIIARAVREYKDKEIEETDDSVKRALWVIDKSAVSPDSQTTHLESMTEKTQIYVNIGLEGAAPSTFLMPIDSSEHASKRAGKDARLQCIPLAKTPYRKEILDEEMKNSRVFLEVRKEFEHPKDFSKHYGEPTESPVNDTFPERPTRLWNGRPSRRIRNGISGSPVRQPQVVVPTIPDQPPRNFPRSIQHDEYAEKSREKSDRHVAFAPNSPPPDGSNLGNGIPYTAEPNLITPGSSIVVPSHSAQQQLMAQTAGTTPSPPPPVQDPDLYSTLESLDPARRRVIESYMYKQQSSVADNLNTTTTPPPAIGGALRIITPPEAPPHSPAVTTPECKSTLPNQIGLGDTTYLTQSPGIATPDEFTGSPSKSVTEDMFTSATQHEAKGKSPTLVERPQSHSGSSVIAPVTIPPPHHVYHLEWDICKVRQELEAKKPQSNFAKFKAWMGKEYIDEDYAKHISDRDIVFVIDNGTTMARHWPITRFVAQTLGMKVAGLDDDGVDVKFTINGKNFNRERLHGIGGLNELNSLLTAAQPVKTDDENAREATDMNSALHDIFRNYWMKGHQKATTVLVLTDAVWEGTSAEEVNETIVKFARELEADRRRFLPRHFTISFIRFGDGMHEKARLQKLDDNLLQDNGLKDIIDACSWKNRVRKMSLGSLLPYEDKKDTDEDEVERVASPSSPVASPVYDEQALNYIFEEFNSGRHKTILADSSASNSRASSSLDLSQGEATRRETDLSFLSTKSKARWGKKLSFGSSKDKKRSP